jgi:acetylornithine deacetylase/succinyl-diaminopimelate desuccinylase-like protein
MSQISGEAFREALARRIDERADEFLSWLVRLAAIPSVSATNEGIRECASELTALMNSLGIATEILETGGGPIVRGTVGSGRPRVVVYGHYDVQPAEESEGWAHPPFVPIVRDGALWGRGVGDNKGQLLAHLCAIAAWRDVHGEPPPFEIVFTFDGEEEIGSPHSIRFIRDNASLFGGDFVYGADGSTLGVWNPAIFLEFHGLLYLELRARGATAEWHSGSYGSILPNPVLHLAGALRSMVAEDGRVLVEGFYDDVVPPTPRKRQLLDELPPQWLADAGAYGAARFATDKQREAMFFLPKMCVCGFAGGYGGDGVKTAVPTSAVAKLDITLAPAQTPEKIAGLVRQHLDAHGFADVELSVLSSCPPVTSDYDDLWVQLTIQALTNVWHKVPTVFPSIGGGGPFSAFAHHGMKCVGVPYAQADLHEHSIEEHLSIEWFVNGIKTSAELFRLLAEVDAP